VRDHVRLITAGQSQRPATLCGRKWADVIEQEPTGTRRLQLLLFEYIVMRTNHNQNLLLN